MLVKVGEGKNCMRCRASSRLDEGVDDVAHGEDGAHDERRGAEEEDDDVLGDHPPGQGAMEQLQVEDHCAPPRVSACVGNHEEEEESSSTSIAQASYLGG